MVSRRGFLRVTGATAVATFTDASLARAQGAAARVEGQPAAAVAAR